MIVIAPEDEYVTPLEEWGATHIDVELDKSGMNPFADRKYLSSLKSILKKERPDIALTYTIKPNIYGSLACKSLKIPVVNNVSGLGTTFLWKSWVQKAASLLYKRAFSRSNFIFFQNKDDRKLFLDNVNISSEKTGLLPGSGINLTDYQSSFPEFNSPLRVLMVGRLIIDKGVLEYIDAAEKLHSPNLKFLLAGGYDPSHKRAIGDEIFQNLSGSDSIDYLGHIENMKEVISSADLIVLPSYREGTPRTLLEGAALSRPLIATDVPGCREVVEDGVNGFLCEKESSESLVRKIKLFLSLTKDEKIQMAKASRNLVEKRFDETIVIQEYMRKINQLTKA